MCSYCGCRESLSIIARYSAEHEDIVNALGDLRRADHAEDVERIRATAHALRALLDPHTASEERALFAPLRALEEFTKTVDDLCAEHTHIEQCVADVEARLPGAYATLERVLMRHIDKEENGLFPAAIMVLDGEAWDRATALA